MKTIEMGPDECWPWIGATTGKANKKYGKLFIGREFGRTITEYAHRFSWQIHFGPIEPGMEVDHTCNNGLCVNPNHFELVTQGVNKSREGSRQTRCVHGHTYTVLNTYIDGDGHRRCRTCAEARRAA
jgi:hypothetical protein